jgi:hypothetical protein
MALEQDLASIAEHCEQLIRMHEYNPDGDVCIRCGRPWACYARLTAEELLEGLQRLPLLDPALTGAGTTDDEGARVQTDEGSEGWRTSSFSDTSGGNQVEVRSVGRAFAVRDSGSIDGPLLVFSTSAWLAFTQGVRAGEFDE